MSVYLEIDSDDGLPLASNTGWGDVCKWAEGLPKGTGSTLKHLCAYGWEQDIAVMVAELAAAMKQSPPREDVLSTLTNLQSLMKSKPNTVVVAVTNGMTADSSDKSEKKTATTNDSSSGKLSAMSGKKDSSNALGKDGKVMGTPGSSRAAALNMWQTESVVMLDRMGSANVPAMIIIRSEFEPHERELMAELLPDCTTPEMVRAAFSSLQKGIYLCRHAQTDENKEGKLLGWLNNPLNAQGKKDAKTVGKWLLGKSVDQVRRSDLKRAKQTADRIMEEIGIDTAYEVGFWYRDWSLGFIDTRDAVDVEPLVAHYVLDNPDNAPDEGETFNKFIDRCLPRISALMEVVDNPTQIGNVIALVTHSSVLRACVGWLDGGAKVPTDENVSYTIDKDAYLSLPMGDSTIIWMASTPKGWKWKLVDPLGDGRGVEANL